MNDDYLTKKINVALISSFPPPFGGLTTWSTEYLDVCNKINIFPECVNTNYTNRSTILLGKRNILYEIKRSMRIWHDLRKVCNRTKVDVVHLCSPCSLYGNFRDIITLRIARNNAKKAKIVLHCHCDLNYFVGTSFVKKAVFRYILKYTDVVFVMNRQSLNYMEKLCGSNSNAVLIPNFLQYKPLKTEDNLKQDRVHVLFLGRCTKLKGFDIFLEVAKKVKEKCLDNIVFDVVGDFSEEFEAVDIPQNVNIYGQLAHDDALQFMAQADILLFPSRTEGFPYVILEAMMYNTAVVASDVGAIKEMLNGTEAEVIEGFESDDYFKAVFRICTEHRAEYIGTLEYNKYIKEYSPEIVIEEIKKQYLS